MALEKLTIQRKKYGEATPDTGWKDAVTCLFNPEKITIDKKVKHKAEAQPNTNIGSTSFGGGEPATVKMELFFDTTDKGEDVRVYTDRLFDLMLVERSVFGFNYPPDVRFVWGKMVSFLGHLKKVKVDYLMFLADGTPVRAKAKVDLEQRLDEKKFVAQNPTSRSEARKMRVVVAGERLDLIAYEEYGNSGYWRHLARENNLSNPMELRPGQVLNIVPLPW